MGVELVSDEHPPGWTECIGVWGKSQRAVFEGLETIRVRMGLHLGEVEVYPVVGAR